MILAIILLTAFINLLLGIISYKKNPRSATHRLLTALTLIFASWTIANYFSLNSPTAEGTLFWIRAVMFITAPLGPTLYLFIKAFPHAKLRVNKIVLFLLVGLTLTVQAIAFTPLLFSSVTVTGTQITPTPAPGLILFALLFVGAPIAGFIEIFKKYRKSTGIEKQQLKYLVFGISVTFGLLIITNFITVVLFKVSNFVIFGPIFSLIFVGFIFYAIVRHRLLTIRLVIARSVAYTLLIFVLASIYTLGVFFISNYFFANESVSQQRITSILIAIFLVLTFEPLKKVMENITETIFFRGSYNTDELILRLTTLTASTYNLKELTQETLQKLLNTFQLDRGAFIIYRKQGRHTVIYDGFTHAPQYSKEIINEVSSLKRLVVLDEEKDKKIQQLMNRLNMVVALPLIEHDRTEGLLLLGNKKSGETYTPQDIKILEIFGPIVSLAIQNAKSYDEIRSFNKTLSEKIATATKELKISHTKLQTLDKQKDKFIGMASHELKTPITSIKAFTQVLQKRVEENKHKNYAPLLENINKQTDRVTKLINDLLNVSNIEAGKLILKIEKFDFDALITKTVSDLQYTSDKHTIIKKGNLKKPVYGDTDRLEQVLANLITNAIKYSPHADKVIVNVAEKDNHALVSITDFGTGIDKKDQQRIFERFYRTRENEERNIAGFGLGLYIASEIIQRHGGTIWVESTKGKGATFSFTIPFTP